MTNAISVEGVSKRFRIYKNRNQSLKGAFLQRSRAQFEEFWALDDVSFDIPQGKTFGLLGHNGSGKSTLLKCIAKILTPDKGTISSTGRMAAMLEVGSGFHPELSGRENIYLNGAILGMSKKEIDSKLEMRKAGGCTCTHPPLSHALSSVMVLARLGSRSPHEGVAARTVPTRITMQHTTCVAVGTVPCRTRAKMIAHAE